MKFYIKLIQGLKCDWAAGKDMPESQKSTWVKEEGCNYVKYPQNIKEIETFNRWGYVDPESVPSHLKG